MHSEKHHLPAGAWVPQHGQLVAEESARGSTWLRVGRQHPVSPEPASSSAGCPAWDVALFWGGFDGPQHLTVSAQQGWLSASLACGAGTGGKQGVLAKFAWVIAGRASRLLL